ncbi:hypothetical protein [uncultured Streptococcus sp.]|uniref:hypothetical protein n=1 Tax=uncultured Streptococcus sp. TaxID=83427 RepID=UPI00259472B9|nr:hypothetical protein [uncultured Streptococcus sp.]
MAKTVAEETKNATSAVQKAIPSRYNYQVSSHPSYDELSDEYMRKVINRKNLETDYARAVGELKQKPSKGKIAMEALEIIGAIAAIGVSASVIGLNAMNIDEKSKKKNNK